ncbi:HEAT repeat domain-containing protein [Anaeromyxobacter paludicola]|uniref:HEAT repeat domain-containing protein n=1 Tax=Anaeromyxobacter paludicola TaxID=2918171 RepID=A0ABM7XB71_9BACT|nr:HEAT repeat domain-containing protein [Anaeromyxobacter paludicola]BDG09114.1 hypothetical protein AMPC_22270 [Anaeromyxobacter paludicola]
MTTPELERAFSAGDDAPEVLAALQDPRPEAREQAIALAARHLSPELLGRLVGDDENAVLRNAALAALERQGPYAVPHLMALSRGANLEVAMFAVQILSRIRDPGTVDALLPLLEHPDPNIAQAAVEALGGLRAPEAVPGIVRLLGRELWLQFAAVTALGDIGDPRAAAPLLELVEDELLAEPAVEALGKLRAPEALPRLLSLLARHERLPLRDQLLLAVAEILEARPAPAPAVTRFRRELDEGQLEGGLRAYLGPLLGSEEAPLSRAAASLALAARLDRLFPAVVRRALAGDAEEGRWTAALCRRHEQVLGDHLPELLRDPDPAVRQGALRCAPASADAVPLALERMSDPDPAVRAAACQALGRCRDVAAIPVLVGLFDRGTPPEAGAAAEALGRMPGQSLVALGPLLERADKVLPALEILEAAHSPLFQDRVVELLDAEPAHVRRAALRLLVHHDLDFEAHLVRKLRDPDESVRAEAVELIVRNGSTRAVPALVGLLPVAGELRYQAIRALGRLRAAAAAPELERLFPAADGHERLEIVSALVRIGAPGLLPFLRARLGDGAPELRRVAADGVARTATEAELDLLAELARDRDWSVRNDAGWGLGRLGLARSRALLLELVRDPEPLVARTARAALAKLPSRGEEAA